MSTVQDLYNKDTSARFYDDRYEEGYMEEWDEGKKQKVREIIASLGLPGQGTALDFGCGNGVFTHILKQCLPAWDVYGVEISKVAVANATRKFPACRFFTADESHQYNGRFDFVFSHHVIEHVPDVKQTFRVINAFLKEHSVQLHILPCGNPGSLEHRICQLKKNGIMQEQENRFFFEEPGHLRRLTSNEFERLQNELGFRLEKEFYSNQYFGAVNWITKSSPRFVKKLTADGDAVDEKAKVELKALRKKLLPLTYLQFPYSKYTAIRSKWKKKLSDKAKLAALFFPALVSKPIFDRIEKLSDREWSQRKHEKNGSEMFLFFRR